MVLLNRSNRKWRGHFFEKNFSLIFLTSDPLGVILCEESVARIPEPWKRFLDPDSGSRKRSQCSGMCAIVFRIKLPLEGHLLKKFSTLPCFGSPSFNLLNYWIFIKINLFIYLTRKYSSGIFCYLKLFWATFKTNFFEKKD